MRTYLFIIEAQCMNMFPLLTSILVTSSETVQMEQHQAADCQDPQQTRKDEANVG